MFGKVAPVAGRPVADGFGLSRKDRKRRRGMDEPAVQADGRAAGGRGVAHDPGRPHSDVGLGAITEADPDDAAAGALTGGNRRRGQRLRVRTARGGRRRPVAVRG